jgi:hypothetical protein
MTELPEPACTVSPYGVNHIYWGAGHEQAGGGSPLFTKAQMLQFRRDALNEAALVCEVHQTKWLKEAARHKRGRFSEFEQRDLERAHLCEKDARAIHKLKDET